MTWLLFSVLKRLFSLSDAISGSLLEQPVFPPHQAQDVAQVVPRTTSRVAKATDTVYSCSQVFLLGAGQPETAVG
jgi:hypothetical protein